MSRLKPAALVALTTLLVVGLLFPAGAAAGFGDSATDSAAAQQDNTTSTDVSVEVGEQLSTVTTTTSEEIRTEAESAGFEQRLASANATDRAELIAERAAELQNSSDRLRAEYANLTAASQQGNITVDAYAQRIAGLSAAATNIDRSVTKLSKQAAQLPAAERQAVGVTEDDLAAITEGINPLTGQTASAVLGQFTGQGAGEISIEIGDRIELSVESDGERSRQFERARDNNGANTYELNQSEALAVAESELSQPSDEWTLTGVSTDDGAYEFEFRYTGPGEGEAEVSVDGSTGTVFALEESIEAPENDDDEDDELDDLAIGVSSGEPAPGANVTLSVTGNGEPVSNATVMINDEQVGTTDENGEIDVTLPDEEEIEIEAELNDAEGELEFEFEGENEEDELGATADIDGDTITVFVVLDGQPVDGATVTLNENVTKTTGSDGTASFTFNESELDIDIEYNDLEAELEYELEYELEDEEDEDEGDDEDGEDDGDESEEQEEGDEEEGEEEEGDEESEETETDDTETEDEEDEESEEEDEETDEDDEDEESDDS